ncbi:hydroxyethylthiazole kinase [Halobacillus salinarum]|uniref:Hydroxyethylthiazole kinase n=1 Tax=Halobacillus salinarum TaxID=2932257 RepID=A0ABY4EM75_9BACI|nr:hydroxyethylthiazole kinase [Halobacillus salinarum]UOQ45102.1 hydroxyethylthiazole kinase [Halobacillus salinarum]
MNEIVQKVRAQEPLIHNLTNAVVMNFSANGLLAFGASPIMANAKEDAADVAKLSNGVLINIGTLTEAQLEAMIEAGKAANEAGIPVVIDPVGVAATNFRTEAFQRIVEQVHPDVIKGNAGELAHLVGIELETKGVDAVGEGNSQEIAGKVAVHFQTIAVLTGKVDTVSDGKQTLTNETGHALLSKVTGAGCLLGSIITACLSVEGENLEKAYAAVKYYGMAAAYAASQSGVNGPGTFLPQFLDALTMEPDTLEKGLM